MTPAVEAAKRAGIEFQLHAQAVAKPRSTRLHSSGETILVSVGRRGLQIELRPQDLVELTDARVAAVVAS